MNNALNLYTSANQIQTIGSRNPPNTVTTQPVLNAASPNSFSLNTNTGVNTTNMNSAKQACRTYEDVRGLRRLQQDQIGRSELSAGCGWAYNPSTKQGNGILGTMEGPADTMQSGFKYYWNLEDAERDMSTAICTQVSKCRSMAALGKNSEVCGFCKQTGAMIPVTSKGARYPRDSVLMCDPDQIVRNVSQCPPQEGFSIFNANSPPVNSNPTFSSASVGLKSLEGFKNMNGLGMGVATLRESFIGQTYDDLMTNCSKGPLSRDCVILAARLSGCSDKGTLIQSLQGSTRGDYDSVLKTKPSFMAYREVANPNITPAVLKDGSAAVTTAITDFQSLLTNTNRTSEKDKKLKFAAEDLCLRAGAYDNYNFCGELIPSMLIPGNFISCLQKDWLERGGAKEGTGYSTLNTFIGRYYQTYLNYINKLVADTKSTNKETQVRAIQEFIGMNTSAASIGLPMDDTTRGGEVVWIDIVDATNGNRAPIIYRSDILFAKDGPVYPIFDTKEEMARKYRVPGDNIALTTIFEIRPDTDQKISIEVTSDDGFMIGVNQNPFQGLSTKFRDWGSWRYQGPTTYNSPEFIVEGKNKDARNMIVSKWFNGGGLAAFNMRFKTPSGFLDQINNFQHRKDFYLIQEPLAPWLQYEICSRPNTGKGAAMGLFEKRWNGQAAFASRGGAPINSFDTNSGSVTIQTGSVAEVPGKKGYLSFNSGSFWFTQSKFAFTAFKTLVLLVRPIANIAKGETVSVFQHINFENTWGTGLYLKNRGGVYSLTHWVGGSQTDIAVTMNEWNMIFLQYNSDFGADNLYTVTCDTVPLSQLKTRQGRSSFLQRLKEKQNTMGSILYRRGQSSSGNLILGGSSTFYTDAKGIQSWKSQSFTGDVAWIHGFRTYIDSEAMLEAEVNQTWVSRFPIT